MTNMISILQSKLFITFAHLIVFSTFVLYVKGDKITGTNTREICQSFKTYYFPDNKFKTSCSCKEESGSNGSAYKVSCKDKCENCFDGICTMYSLNAKLEEKAGGINNEFEITYSKDCSQYGKNDFNGVEFCFVYDVDSDVSPYHVNDLACRISSDLQCQDGNTYGDYLVDCSNLGYGNAMNLCEKSDQNGQALFDHYIASINADWSSYSVGECSSASSLKANSVFALLSSIALFTTLSLF